MRSMTIEEYSQTMPGLKEKSTPIHTTPLDIAPLRRYGRIRKITARRMGGKTPWMMFCTIWGAGRLIR